MFANAGLLGNGFPKATEHVLMLVNS